MASAHRPSTAGFSKRWAVFFLLGLAMLTLQAAAQPPTAERVVACAILKASLKDVRVPDSTPADTDRLQQALSRCNPGEAVVLEAEGKQTGFLSAPLVLPRGVFLYISQGVTLYASKNPRDYDLKPMSCGGPMENAAVCKPFLFAYQAARSGVLGAGTIDGQGWAGGAESAPDLISSYESQEFSVRGISLHNAAGASLAVYKTIDFHGEAVRIDSRTSSPALLLSNAQSGKLENFAIHAVGVGLDLRPSILGATEKIKIDGLRMDGGAGIQMGDPVYGSVKEVSFDNVAITGSSRGLSFDLRSDSRRNAIDNIRVHSLCMKAVMQPVEINGPQFRMNNALLDLRGAIVDGVGVLTSNAVLPDASAHCSVTTLPPSPNWRIDLAHLHEQGKKAHLMVARDGSGDFTSIDAAVRALPATGGEIAVRPGSYREVVTIRKPHVHLYGTDPEPKNTVVVFDNSGPRNAGTFNSATVFVEADDVSIDHLTIANDTGNKGQAVALTVTADRASFRHLRLLGAQDTLFAAARYCYGDYGPCVAARQYFSDCSVEGNVDFIFGDSLAVFDRCELHGIAGRSVMFTAQGRHTASQQAGFVFDHCHLTADPASQSVTLGRPWRPYAEVIYLDSVLDAPIIPAGWTEWPRFGVPSLPTAVYAEFHSTGPGASDSTREAHARILTAAEAEGFRAAHFLAGTDGWNPGTKAEKP